MKNFSAGIYQGVWKCCKESEIFFLPCEFLERGQFGKIYSEGIADEKNKRVLDIKCPWSHWSSKIKYLIENEVGGKDKNRFYFTTEDFTKIIPIGTKSQEIPATGAGWAYFVAWFTVFIHVVKS